MPLESATVQATLSAEDRGKTRWSNTDELGLVLLNLTAAWRYEWLLANTDRRDHHSIRKPEPLLRPWESILAKPSGPPRMATRDEMRAFFGAAITYTPAEAPAAS